MTPIRRSREKRGRAIQVVCLRGRPRGRSVESKPSRLAIVCCQACSKNESRPLFCSRYKCFPVESDEYFYAAARYVERNALRAGLGVSVEQWPWSSLALAAGPTDGFPILADWPLPRPANWGDIVNRPQSEAELAALRKCVNRGCPWGDADWTAQTSRLLGIESTLRTRGRPKQKI